MTTATAVTARREWRGMLLPTAVVVACTLAVAAAAGPLYALSERTAHDLLDRSDYITEVSRR
jgi:multicomponent Na+:H+ antiporter subunit D